MTRQKLWECTGSHEMIKDCIEPELKTEFTETEALTDLVYELFKDWTSDEIREDTQSILSFFSEELKGLASKLVGLWLCGVKISPEDFYNSYLKDRDFAEEFNESERIESNYQNMVAKESYLW